ncbi:MAG: hypothetical protein PX638_08965 [Microcystis sp. M53599_WE4]|nr:hypothetical protein [Microcystis aeruginosa]MDJ0559233.1 hypothetical protein [Microcystis sp. M53599_WE4]WNF13742.1 hypothetical protein RKE53_16860 [Microcystis aeruginosa NRERC-214]
MHKTNRRTEITEPDLSELKRLGIDEIALAKGQKNYCSDHP